MSSIWIILLDVSGSMRDPFSGRHSNDPTAEAGRWATKIDAAKDLLKKQIAASNAQDIAVITFGDTADKLFHGSRRQFAAHEAQFMKLTASSQQTNLAGALDLVADDPAFERYDSLSVLVLSDGLANVGDPGASATRVIEKYPHGRIDMILIDVTDEGERYAREVSLNGWVRPAFSFLQLAQSLTSGKVASISQALTSLSQKRYALEYELATTVEQSPPALMSVVSPLVLTPRSLAQRVAPTLIALEQLEQVASDLRDRPYEGRITSISQSSPVSINLSGLDTALEVVLEIFLPWRRKNAEELAALKRERLRLENRKIELELQESASRIRQKDAEAEMQALEARLHFQETEEIRELRRQEHRLLQMKLEISRRLLRHLGRDVAEMDRGYEQRVLEAVDRLIEGGLEFEIQTRPEQRLLEEE